jgi:flagellin-like protein
MMTKNFSVVAFSDEKGTAPVIGTALSIAIVFILAGLVSAVIFSGYADSFHKGSPAAKLTMYFSDDGSSLEFKHDGGDHLFFDSSSLSVIMDINGTSYPLNDSALGTLGVGEIRTLDLNKSEELPAMKLEPGDRVSVKVVDYESGALIAKRELEVKRQMVIKPELPL